MPIDANKARRQYARGDLLVITSTFPRWAGDTDPPFVFELCRRLSRHFRVQVLAPHAPGTQKEETYHGVLVRRFRYFFASGEMLAYDGGILNRLRQKRRRYFVLPFFVFGELLKTTLALLSQSIGLVNAHWILPQGLVAVVARLLVRSTVPVVCTVHGGDIFALQGPLLARLKRFVLSRCDAAIVVSRAIRHSIVSLGIPEERVQVIPMGVDLHSTFVPPRGHRAKGTLLFVGRLVEKKGVRYLLEAMPLVLQKHPEVCLTIVGQGPEEYELRNLAGRLGLQHALCMRGAIENSLLPELYQSAEIVVFPSIVEEGGDTEGFGLVLVEALGCECAVVASDLPAVHDIIVDSKTGLLCAQRNTRQLADRINYLLDNPGVMQGLGMDGRRYVLERYDWSVTTEKHRNLFASLMR